MVLLQSCVEPDCQYVYPISCNLYQFIPATLKYLKDEMTQSSIVLEVIPQIHQYHSLPVIKKKEKKKIKQQCTGRALPINNHKEFQPLILKAMTEFPAKTMSNLI